MRGISILLVVCHHIGLRMPLDQGFWGAHAPRWVLTLLNWRGNQAVFLFFVLSGFFDRAQLDGAVDFSVGAEGRD